MNGNTSKVNNVRNTVGALVANAANGVYAPNFSNSVNDVIKKSLNIIESESKKVNARNANLPRAPNGNLPRAPNGNLPRAPNANLPRAPNANLQRTRNLNNLSNTRIINASDAEIRKWIQNLKNRYTGEWSNAPIPNNYSRNSEWTNRKVRLLEKVLENRKIKKQI